MWTIVSPNVSVPFLSYSSHITSYSHVSVLTVSNPCTGQRHDAPSSLRPDRWLAVRRELSTDVSFTLTLHTSYHLLTAWYFLPIFGTINIISWTVIVLFLNWIQMATYLTSLFSLFPTATPTPLNWCFDYGLGCFRQVYQSDGGTRLTRYYWRMNHLTKINNVWLK